ncbi:MAG: hypothetical protein A3C06_03690 [Candidatus Taylorbacteria bacterium RIFCSPHIGHO2_02_FULL_46_13]|uniref:UDP-N-acetylmuramyl-tripeptide synthetase n=1 Tax=Candidatus Taylorbacteria bacterium RIFCSPHIGHO2_02_FULL_46_13 TaxID=1802312 RepID=A0A1G2MSJ1_9BACT|nr:MAG: hypothetical protein A3C06_03690 [Candidatus Taylorbacteria bacterium RIFCSPHIGHO2_02_FULL_46_13]
MESILRLIKKTIPQSLFQALQPIYHYKLALLGALIYRFPSRHIKVVGITGTKGKTSTAELVNAVLEATGYKTALAGTLRFKIGERSEPNLFKMTMPGRFFTQKFLRQAVNAGCQWAVLEMTSEGVKQFRHKFIDLDALIFTNLSPEHIESHGSYEKYLMAKLKLAEALARSPKQNRVIIVNADDKEGGKFLAVNVPRKLPFHLRDAGAYKLNNDGVELIFKGERIISPLRGLHNVYNIMAAVTFADSQNIPPEIIKKGIEKVSAIKGRGEEVRVGQLFAVIVDYAHTPESLRAIYKSFEGKRKIAVLGNTGGGRDKWKRPEMGKIANEMCETVILTNEDPYDENPRAIVDEMTKGMIKKPEIIMDRRAAIARAISIAHAGDVVLITGKGTDPFIMGPKGSKTPWSDFKVAQEELQKLLSKSSQVIS